ncbi:MAG: arabinofuranosyltransferase [Carbonactinosporaceae bacterium]
MRDTQHPERSTGTDSRSLVPSSIAAVAAWLVATPLAVLLVRLLDLDPFTARGVVMPVAVGAVQAVAVVALAVRRRSELVVGAAAGLYAAWLALVLRQSLHGTPYGFLAIQMGDELRLATLANRFTVTLGSADAFVRGLPSEYPPLYPWLIARASVLLDRPAYTLMGDAEVLTLSTTVLVGFLLWRRLVPAPAALAVAALLPAVFGAPNKAYEVITLAVFAPWALATFVGLPRRSGGLHWLPAGVIGGLSVLTYVGYLMFGCLGLLALIGWAWLRTDAADRLAYLLYLLKVAVVATAVSGWYVLPLAYGYLTKTRNVVSDLWVNEDIPTEPLDLPFLDPTPLGMLQLAGLVGVLWFRKREWWAQPLLLLLLGTYAYWLLFLARMVLDGHTGFLVKTPRMVGALLLAAGVLTVLRAAPVIARRLAVPPPRSLLVGAMTVLLMWAGMAQWVAWSPYPRGFEDLPADTPPIINGSTVAHLQTLPDGSRPRYAPENLASLPTGPVLEVREAVQAWLPPGAQPVVLSDLKRLFVFVPWHGYVQMGEFSANSLTRWHDRHAELERLSGITDPERFARASARTRFGPIDVFVLTQTGGTWRWKDVAFDPDAFGSGWHVTDDLPGPTVVAVRRS